MSNNDTLDPRKIQAFYEDYFELTGSTIGWPSTKAALAIYHEGSNSPYQCWDTFDSLLDVGSGEGHFVNYLRDFRFFPGEYVGIEILPMFYEQSIALYGHQARTKFILADFLKYEFGSKKFDWVTSLGSLSVKQNLQKEHDIAVCHKINQISRYGFSIYINDPNDTPAVFKENTPDLAYHDPDEFISMLKNELGVPWAEAVTFPTDHHSHGTMIHAKLY